MSTILEEIKNVCLSNESNSAKVAKLMKDYGYKKKQAEKEIEYMKFVARMAKLATQSSIAFTYGVEIECFNVDKSLLIELLREKGVIIQEEGYNHRDHTDGVYKMVSDCSIDGQKPVEVVTPVLKDFDSLKKCCEALTEVGARVNRSCGLHVHVGMRGYSAQQIYRIAQNYKMIEGVIDSFMPPSRRNGEYCQALPYNTVARQINDRHDLYYMFGSRYYKVNLQAYSRHETIEFRQHSGTIEYEKIKNWIEFIAGLCSYSIQNEKLLACDLTLGELPFINDNLKSYYKLRQELFANI